MSSECYSMRKKYKINLPGCGGMYPYVYGICGALQDYVNVNDLCFTTISGSTPGVSTILFKAPAKASLASFESKKQSLLDKSSFMIYLNGEFIRMAKEHNIELAQRYSTEKDKLYAMKYHKIMVVHTKTNTRMMKSDFTNFEDYVNSCCASCSFVELEENGPFIDGCMIGSQPDISYFGDRLKIPLTHMNRFEKLYYIIMGLFTCKVWDTLFERGYKDAEEHLISSIREHI